MTTDERLAALEAELQTSGNQASFPRELLSVAQALRAERNLCREALKIAESWLPATLSARDPIERAELESIRAVLEHSNAP
jgi:hypothetical protein